MSNGEELKYSVACPACPSRFKVSASKIGLKGSKFRCPRCGSPFLVQLINGITEVTLVDEPPAHAGAEPMKPSTAMPPTPAVTEQESSQITTSVADEMAGLFGAPAASAAGLALSGASMEGSSPEAPPPQPAAPPAETPPGEPRWKIDLADYAEQSFGIGEIRTLVRDGGLYPTDRVARVESAEFQEAGTVPEFQRFFELKEMLDKKKAAAAMPGAERAAAPAQHACANHPQWEADFRCTKCGRYLCVHCVEEKQAGSSRYKVCKACQDLAKKVDKSYEIPPFYKKLPTFFAAPLRGWGPVMLLINAVLLVVGKFGMKYSVYPLIFVIFYLMVLAYLLWIVKYSARGRETVPDWPDARDFFDLAAIGGRASMVTFFSFLPTLVVVALFLWGPVKSLLSPSPAEEIAPVSEMMPPPEAYQPEAPPTSQFMPSDEGQPADSGEEGGGVPDTSWVEQMAVQQGAGTADQMSVEAREQYAQRQQESVAEQQRMAAESASQVGAFLEKGLLFIILVCITLLFGFVYYPMSLAIAAVWNTWKPMLNPAFVFRLIRRIAGEYVLFLVLFAAVTVISWLFEAGAGLISYVGGFIGALFSLYFGFVSSFMLGWMCYSNDERLGWEEEIYPGR